MIQQRRLPNPRLTPDYEHTAAPTPRSLTQPIQGHTFIPPTAQGQLPGSWLTDSHQNRDPKRISAAVRLQGTTDGSGTETRWSSA